MNNAIAAFGLVAAAAHLVLFGIAIWQRSYGRDSVVWLLATIGSAAAACLAYVLPETSQLGGLNLRGLLLIIAVAATQVGFGGLVIQDTTGGAARPRLTRIWLAANAGWVTVAVVMGLLMDAERVTLGESGWLVRAFTEGDLAGIVALLGLVASGVFLIGLSLQRFYVAVLPEIANRALYWVLNAAVLLQTLVLVVSGTEVIAAVGMVALVMASAGMAHGYVSYRVFDIRSALVLAMRTVAFVGIAAAMVFAALYLVLSTGVDPEAGEGLLVMGAIALVIAALSVPLRQGVEVLIRQMTRRKQVDPTHATRDFSKQVAEATELKTLVSNAIANLNRVMRVRRSALILLTSTHRVKDAVELEVMQPGGDQDGMKGLLSVYSPIYDNLAAKRVPLTQFDISYNPRFLAASDEERAFFASLNMNAYAPVVLETTLIGIVTAGPKLDDTAFYAEDLELLTTLAQQTGIALRNARHVDDLQHLYRSMQSLYQGLKSANDELNKMDAVKSDFVTIASHELRTPLAQIRGYTDIVDALNEQGMLDKDQTIGLVSNLRKATERMEELIAAMLDVSQLDVDAMDLRLTQTPLESVVRMAIEPLTDAINQRKIALSSRGLRGLPPIQADLPRLVQAFRNVIVNAIKFTPDGGRIDIVASVEEARSELEGEHVRVEIRDTGVGIDKRNLELIFKKFFREDDPSLHSTGTYKFLGAGPGLGLTIARGVIEGHGGRIWAESDGHDMENFPGSVFVIRLPVTAESVKRTMTFEGELPDEPTRSEGTVPVPMMPRQEADGVTGD